MKRKEKILYLTVAVVGLLVTLILGGHSYGGQIAARMMIAACMAGGLDLCVGIAGQLSLGHAVFMAVGAYSCAVVCRIVSGLGGIFLGILAALACAAVLAFLLGAVLLNLRGDYLAVSTLGMGEIVRVLLENFEPLGGAAGFYDIPKFTTPFVAFAVMLLCLGAAAWFKQSKSGFLSRAVGQDEEASMAIGVDTHRSKMGAFIMSAVLVAVAGALYAGLLGFISPRDFAYSRSVDILAAVIIGGTGTIGGPMLAAMLIEGFFAVFQAASVLRMILYAVALICFTIVKYRKRGRAS